MESEVKMGDLGAYWKEVKPLLKEKHVERVSKNPERVDFAIKQFEQNDIEYQLKNPATGHFHCWRKSDGKLFQFYAGTGKIQGHTRVRGIHALISMLKKEE